MAKRVIGSFPIAGCVPEDPRLLVSGYVLTARQLQELTALLRSNHASFSTVQRVEAALLRREPLSKILDQLRSVEALAVLRRFSTPAQRQAYCEQQLQRYSPSVTTTKPMRAPKPKF